MLIATILEWLLPKLSEQLFNATVLDSAYADPERGQGDGPPENPQVAIGFLGNTVTDRLEKQFDDPL